MPRRSHDPRNLRANARLTALQIVLALAFVLLPAQPPGAAASDAIGPASGAFSASAAVQPGPTFTVNTLADHDDGTCDDADCTLREAINAANVQAGANTITFSVSGTITLTATLPNVTYGAELTIDGTGQSVTISGNDAVRVFSVDAGAALALQDLTVANGRCDGCNGGGLYNAGTVTAVNSVFSGNAASRLGEFPQFSAGYGGGLYNAAGTATVVNSTFSGNSASDGGGGVLNGFVVIGGVLNPGMATISNSIFSDNSAGFGAGLGNRYGTLTVSNSSFSGNSVSSAGGGLSNDGGTAIVRRSIFSGNSASDGGGFSSWSSILTVADSAFIGNNASTDGGGLSNNSGTLTVTNSTFSGNSSTYAGGGLFGGGNAVIMVSNSTFFGNRATFGGATASYGSALTTLKNTILANSTAGENCSGWIPANGGNNIDDGTSCGFGSANGSLSNTNPLLAPLGSYGGATQTLALLPGSPAIDAGSDAVCADPATVKNLDQRGVARPQGARCDIGAFESRGFTLARTGGDGQSAPLDTAFADPLQLALSSPSGEPVDGGKVTFTAPSSGASTTFAPSTTAPITTSGAVSLTVTANGTAGAYQVAANTAGAVSPVSFDLTNSRHSTATSLTAHLPAPSVVGQSVVFSYTVSVAPPGSGTPTGNVTVSDGTNNCSGTVAAGVCSITFTAPGSYTLSASYAGDASFSGSASSPATVHTVDKAGTATGIAAHRPNPSVIGQAVVVSYTVSVNAPGAGAPSGNVTVGDGGSNSCSGSVAAGACGITFTVPGSYTLTASYAGDASFTGSTSPGVQHTATTSVSSQVSPPLTYQVQATFPISYTVTDPGGRLDRVELWYRWRRSDVPKWSDWALYGSSTASPAAFTAPRGAGVYQFYTVAVDTTGNREARPIGYDAKTRYVSNLAGQSRFFYGTAGDPTPDGPLRGAKVGLWVDWATKSFQVFRMTSAYAVRSNVGAAMAVTGASSAPTIAINYEDAKLKLTNVQINVGADTATGSILDKATGKTYELGDPAGVESPY